MPNYSKKLGNWGEKIAQKYLQKHGYRILSQNYCLPGGQIDLIASLPLSPFHYTQFPNHSELPQNSHQIVFFEIKTRTGSSFGEVEESISWHQKNALIRAAQTWLMEKQLFHCSWQFDLISINLNRRTYPPLAEIKHLHHIFAE